MFILAQVGTGENDGIAGFGVFNTEPYADQNWKNKDGTNRFYAKMSIHFLIDRRKTDMLSASEMEALFPEVNWHKGHSGVLVPSEITEKLVLHLMKKTLYMRKPIEEVSFNILRMTYSMAPFFATYINGLCPVFKDKIVKFNKLSYMNFKEGEPVDPTLIEVSTNKFNVAKLTEASTEDDFVKLFVPVA